MIAVVDYGAGNLRSVELALERLDVPHRRAAAPGRLNGADGVILPGVGAAASAMRALEARGLADALRSWEGPLLGVCLGLQLLGERSAEAGPDGRPVACLGLLPGETVRFGAAGGGARVPTRAGASGSAAVPARAGASGGFALPLPHIGWNSTALRPDPLFEGLGTEAHFYFLHSFRVACPEQTEIARADYGGPFPAAARRGARVGVQFHPEKSGPAGLRVLANFCRAAGLTADGADAGGAA
ncbi:MAG: imidazole glycerol phosphate synthase subunit HisH [Gemmatimonadota bacterium]|nr:imidazole glycerol phosphate synthase subunit HisH [Gemmatimonadota bacterium]